MDITITKTGKTYYQVEPTLASILCELGLAERFVPPPPPPKPVGSLRFAVERTPSTSEPNIHAQCPVCGQDFRFICYNMPSASNARRAVESINKQKIWHCGRGEELPQDIAQQFITACGG